MSWTPAIIQSLMTIAILVGIGLAVIGQVRWRATQEWEALAGARAERIEALEAELLRMRDKVEKDEKLQTVINVALEAQVAEVQRLNLDLQRRLEKSELRHLPEAKR